MTKVKKNLLPFILLCCCIWTAQAQSPEFSQFFASPLQLNPALAGISYGPRVNLNYRNQWPNIDKGYVTYAVSYDQHIEKLSGGIGVAVLADNIAGGLMNNYSIQAMYSYQVAFKRKFGLKMGVSGGIGTKRLDWNRLTFQDQINPIYGFQDAFGNNNPTGETVPQNASILYPDFGAGFIFFTPKVYAGVGVKHLNMPKESLFGNDNRLPLRYAIHAGYSWDLTPRKKNDNVFLSPNIVLIQQSNFSQLNLGAYFHYNFIYFGTFYRNTFKNSDAVIGIVGFRIEYVRIGYSYDFTISDLSLNTGGAHEISFVFNWGGDNNSLRPKGKTARLDCPGVLNF